MPPIVCLPLLHSSAFRARQSSRQSARGTAQTAGTQSMDEASVVAVTAAALAAAKIASPSATSPMVADLINEKTKLSEEARQLWLQLLVAT